MARSGVIYGPSGTFKTTAIAHFARYIARKTGKATLLFSADGGGWESCQEEVNAGMILPYHCDSANIPLPVIRKVSQGYWPRNPDETDIALVDFRPIDWNEIGGMAVEGITSISTMLMRHYADKNIKSGEEATSRFTQPILVNGQLTHEQFGQNSKGHYGGVQNQVFSMINNFTSLPAHYVLFTAHEKRYTEDGELQCGISVPGKAITPLVPTWVGDCIHAQDYNYTVKVSIPDIQDAAKLVEQDAVRVTARYYFTKHLDPQTGAVFIAKPRVTHSKVADLERKFPGGFFVPTVDHGFDRYLDAVDFLAQDAAQADSLKNWREKMDQRLGRTPTSPAAPATSSVKSNTAAEGGKQ